MKDEKNQHQLSEKQLKKDGMLRPMAITLKAVVIGPNEKVLLIKRSKGEGTNKGKWDLPGGHIEKGQTAVEALKREVKEETGLEGEVGPIIYVTEFEKKHPAFKQEKRGLRFIVYVNKSEVELSDEHEEYIWLEINEAIKKLSKKDGFENEKRETLLKAKEYLKMKQSEERWKRTLADFENFKKRTEKSNDQFRKFALEGFVLDLLPVIDNFEMATAHVPSEQEGNGWVEGILHIKNQLLKLLEDNGVSEIPVEKGDKINELIHDVISGEKESKKPKVKKVLKKGFKLNERVIRPASVEAE